MRCTRAESSFLALSSAARRVGLNPFPARLMKYVSMRIPDAGPFGETRFDASSRAIVSGDFVNRPFCGWVESVLTAFTQRADFFDAVLFDAAISIFSLHGVSAV
jgi:hypothetical protein